ncbi:FUSC family protein [Nocardia sp. NPDC052254]|uniref:FUSC family protein n=1 Tax=Nocardia sp. NPDC052254 TaxID=3155681 RepID=UPI00343781AF
MFSASGWQRVATAVWDFFAPRYTPGTMAPNVVAAIVAATTTLVCCLIFGPHLGMIAMMGAFVPFWESGRPLWARLRNSLLVTAAITVSMSAGVLVAPLRWAIVPFSVVAIVVCTVLYYAFLLTRGPSPVMMFYAAVLGTYFGSDPAVGWRMVGVTVFAALLVSVLLLVPLAFAPRAPERRAIASARSAVEEYLRAGDDGPQARVLRNAAYQAMSNAWLTVQSAWPADRGEGYRDMVLELTNIERRLSAAVAGAESVLPEAHVEPVIVRPGWRWLLGHALRGSSVEWFTAWRMGLAAGIAGTISQVFGVGHPYWAILTSAIVINQWMDRVAATRRAAHRTVGTLIGVGVVSVVACFHPTVWWAVAIVVVCMVVQYLLFPLNYALALAALTPMVLVSVGAAGGEELSGLGADRFIDTVIGAFIAVAVAWGGSRFFPRRLVRSQSARAADAVAAVERLDAAHTPEGRRARAQLQYELTHHLSILDRAIGDDPRLADLAHEEHRLADRGYRALARAWCPRPAGERCAEPAVSV